MNKIITVLPVFLLLFFDMISAQQIPCRQGLKPVDNPAVAYKKRNNRCEGFYQPDVSSGSLDLVSLLYGRLNFNPTHDKILHITSPKVRSKQIHIQAVGIPRKTYYRLDAWLQPGGSFEWPLDIAKKEHLQDNHIGLFGQLSDKREIYAPITVINPNNRLSSTSLILTLRSSVDIGSVMWRKNSITEQQCDLSKAEWQTIQPAFGDRFISGEAIELSLPDQKDNFCIEFAAQTIGSASWLKLPLEIHTKD